MPKKAHCVKKIFVAAPATSVSGGPEVLHQLCAALNANGHQAWMLYYPTDRSWEVPSQFRRYEVSTATIKDVKPDSIVVLPETCAHLIGRFRRAQVYFWWLSVDYFFISAEHTRVGKRIGGARLAKIRLWRVRRHVRRHLFQSEYARAFLETNSLAPTSRLGDYLAEEYVEAAAKPPNGARENILVYNPAKGEEQTAAILRALEESGRPMPTVVPLTGMTRGEICDLLGRAKVYIDFGSHPGKDRIPREAAALGACVLTNRRGSAANSIDLPLPDELKIDDHNPEFATIAAEKIHQLMDDYEFHAAQLDAYRHSIALEPAAFLDDVRSTFPTNS